METYYTAVSHEVNKPLSIHRSSDALEHCSPKTQKTRKTHKFRSRLAKTHQISLKMAEAIPGMKLLIRKIWRRKGVKLNKEDVLKLQRTNKFSFAYDQEQKTALLDNQRSQYTDTHNSKIFGTSNQSLDISQPSAVYKEIPHSSLKIIIDDERPMKYQNFVRDEEKTLFVDEKAGKYQTNKCKSKLNSSIFPQVISLKYDESIQDILFEVKTDENNNGLNIYLFSRKELLNTYPLLLLRFYEERIQYPENLPCNGSLLSQNYLF